MDGIRQSAAVAATLALLAGLLWWLRRKGAARWGRVHRRSRMEVLESRALCPGHALHLVRIGNRVMALATHSGGCTLIDSRPSTGTGEPGEDQP